MDLPRLRCVKSIQNLSCQVQFDRAYMLLLYVVVAKPTKNFCTEVRDSSRVMRFPAGFLKRRSISKTWRLASCQCVDSLALVSTTWHWMRSAVPWISEYQRWGPESPPEDTWPMDVTWNITCIYNIAYIGVLWGVNVDIDRTYMECLGSENHRPNKGPWFHI